MTAESHTLLGWFFVSVQIVAVKPFAAPPIPLAIAVSGLVRSSAIYARDFPVRTPGSKEAPLTVNRLPKSTNGMPPGL